mmetsp:Transcript_113674/g.177854  ORF Transcript_113674/g.177854 Transcript_113674/m.177854 type:complete len:90 (+) Transcript_113674:528-797(+)
MMGYEMRHHIMYLHVSAFAQLNLFAWRLQKTKAMMRRLTKTKEVIARTSKLQHEDATLICHLDSRAVDHFLCLSHSACEYSAFKQIVVT